MWYCFYFLLLVLDFNKISATVPGAMVTVSRFMFLNLIFTNIKNLIGGFFVRLTTGRYIIIYLKFFLFRCWFFDLIIIGRKIIVKYSVVIKPYETQTLYLDFTDIFSKENVCRRYLPTIR